MSLTAKRPVTEKKLAANRRNGARLSGPAKPGNARTRRPDKTYEGLTEGTVREFPEGTAAKIKNIVT